METSAAWVKSANRIIKAVGEHIIAEDTLSSGSVSIGIEESAQFGIVITGLEVIQFGLCSGILATMENRAVFKGVFYSQKLPVMIAISV